MDEHLHSGIVSFVTITVYAILGIWSVRLIAAKLVEYPPTALLGKSLGGVVHFG